MKHCKIDRPNESKFLTLKIFARPAYKNHQFAHGALNMQDICALDSDHTPLDTEWRQQDVGAIVLDDLSHLVKAFEENGIELGVSHHDRLHKDLCRHDEIMQALLGTQNAF
jgi:hypothetical protein